MAVTATPIVNPKPIVPAPRRPWRLGGRTRKAVLLAHLVVTGVWLGLDAAMALLVFTAMGTDDPRTASFALQALRLVTVWPMLTVGLLSLVTGIVLGLGGKYGLVRYWWVLVKLVLNVALCLLVLVALPGGVAEAARTGQALATGTITGWGVGDLRFPPIVSPTALLVAFVLSVFKPWGRVRRASRRSDRSAPIVGRGAAPRTSRAETSRAETSRAVTSGAVTSRVESRRNGRAESGQWRPGDRQAG